MNPTLPLVVIPTHINFPTQEENIHHTNLLLASVKWMIRSNNPNFYYLVDINNSNPKFALRIQTAFQEIDNIKITITNIPGRSHALNRGLEAALENNYPGCIFVNDDVFITRGGLDIIAVNLQQHPLVGAIVRARRMIRPHSPLPNYYEPEYAYYLLHRSQIKSPFKGNCFGINIRAFDCLFRFPEIRADGSYLLAYYKAKHKTDPFIYDNVGVFETIPLNPDRFRQAVINHFAGRKQLVDYCQNNCPNLLPFIPKVPNSREFIEIGQQYANNPLIQEGYQIIAEILAQMEQKGGIPQIDDSFWRR